MQPETNDFMCQSCLQVIKENLYDAFYRLTSPKTQITAYVFDVVRAIVPKSDLDDVFITKDEASLCLCCMKLRTLLPPVSRTKLYMFISTGDARSHDLIREFQVRWPPRDQDRNLSYNLDRAHQGWVCPTHGFFLNTHTGLHKCVDLQRLA